MTKHNRNSKSGLFHIQPLKVVMLLNVVFLLTSCGFISSSDPSTKETQIALSIQQTVLARQVDIVASQPPQDLAETEVPVESIEIPTETIESVETESPTIAIVIPSSTTESAELPPTAEIQPEISASESVIETEPPAPQDTIDIDALYENANILLYEDVHFDPGVLRYYRETLDRMGLKYTDVGSAQGNLKTQLVAGAPGGKPWDLVIIASEHHGQSVPGEFFSDAEEALDKGSSVILEVWFLDKTYKSSANVLLAKCGVEFDKNWIRIPPEGMVLYPLAADHPVLNDKNSGLTFTDTTSYWAYEYDVGDLMKKLPNSDAVLLIGTKATDKNAFGTVTICFNGRLTLQSFTAHNFTINAFAPLLENYIHNALIASFKQE